MHQRHAQTAVDKAKAAGYCFEFAAVSSEM